MLIGLTNGYTTLFGGVGEGVGKGKEKSKKEEGKEGEEQRKYKQVDEEIEKGEKKPFFSPGKDPVLDDINKVLKEIFEELETREIKIDKDVFLKILKKAYIPTKERRKIDTRKLAKIYTKPTEIFKSEKKKKYKNTIFTFMIDMSGSMAETLEGSNILKIKFVRDILRAFLDATNEIKKTTINLYTCVVGFEDIGYLIQRATSRKVNTEKILEEIRAGGNTYFADGLKVYFEEIEKFRNAKNILIVLSDMMLDEEDAKESKEILKKIKKTSVDFQYVIFIVNEKGETEEKVKNLFGRYLIYVRNEREFIRAFLSEFSKMIL